MLCAIIELFQSGAPVIAATRLRKGNVSSARGAPRLIGDTLTTLRRATTPSLVIVRADSAYCGLNDFFRTGVFLVF